MEVGEGCLYEVMPGHDAWTVGDIPAVQYDFAGMRTFALPAAGRSERILATLVCTDVVDSTATASRVGPAAWRTMLADLNADSRRQIDKFRGKLAANTGDGLIAIFDGAERAVRCGAALSEAAAKLGLRLRCGVHTGEVELIPDNIRGVAVHVVSRVAGLAAAGEVRCWSPARPTSWWPTRTCASRTAARMSSRALPVPARSGRSSRASRPGHEEAPVVGRGFGGGVE
jgi:Adenylate cyclase, family 3 (some proteins contain HAMP domain)